MKKKDFPKDMPYEYSKKELAGSEPIESQLDHLRKKVRDIEEKQDVILAYLGNIMGVELVKNISNSKLRFAGKDIKEEA